MASAGKVKVLKRKTYLFDEIKYNRFSKKNILAGAKETRSDILFRENIFGSEIIWGDHRFLFPNRRGKGNMRSLYIFAMVKKDALNFLKTHTIPEIKWSSSVFFNNKVKTKGRRLIGTDIDSAYWSISYKMGVISEKTFDKRDVIDNKQLLLASLSTLGRDKRYTQYRQGKPTPDAVIFKGNDDLKNLYKKIRYTCFNYMKQLSRIIGNDFVAYKTDCIYYLYSAENVRKVKKFLEAHEIDYKMVRDYKHFTDYVED